MSQPLASGKYVIINIAQGRAIGLRDPFWPGSGSGRLPPQKTVCSVYPENLARIASAISQRSLYEVEGIYVSQWHITNTGNGCYSLAVREYTIEIKQGKIWGNVEGSQQQWIIERFIGQTSSGNDIVYYTYVPISTINYSNN
jgi:hypothetical protein